MKISGNSIKIGNVIEHKNRLWVAVKTMHTQPGKGGAYLQVELKDIKTGTKLNERFRSSETVERVHMDEEEYQFLFAEGDTYTFMNVQSYDQVGLTKDFIGGAADYLQESMIVKIISYESEPVGVELPETVVMKIVEADPVVKGQTASSSYKPAILENGLRVMVPPHIESGVRVVVNTADGTYVEKAKD
ncbi:MAG: elongation factor P [Alphaproteobacteria bacterium]